MSDFVLDASLTLQWFLEDETDRKYSLAVLARLAENRGVVPIIWFYEVGNGLLMAHRRKRITFEQVDGFVERLKSLGLEAAEQTPSELLELPVLAKRYSLTNYDAAYLAVSLSLKLPLATTDGDLRRAASAAGAKILTA